METRTVPLACGMRPFLTGAGLVSLALAGGCTGDAAMDTSLASITGGLIAAATGDHSTAQELASVSQYTYAQAQTGAYQYDAGKAQSWTGSGPTTSQAAAPSGAGQAPHAGFSASHASLAAEAYPPSMGELGARAQAARPATCAGSLAYLDPILPHSTDLQIESLRGQLIATDLSTAASYGPQGAADAAAARDQFRVTYDEAVATVRATSSAPDTVLGQVFAGTFQFHDGVEGQAARAVQLATYGLIGAHEIAVATACRVASA
jgi:hypothetical protein